MPSELLTKYFEEGLDTRKGRNPLGMYRAPDSGGFENLLQQIEQSDEFLQNFQTPSDIDEYKNYILSTGFTEALGSAPFKITGENRAIFDTSAKPQVIEDTDIPKQKAFKKLWNVLVAGRGGVSTGNLAQRTFDNSMTGSWAKMLGLGGDMSDFSFQDDGVYFDGHRLKLSDTQLKIVSDFQNRVSGIDRDTSFFDKAGESFLSIMWDMPLIVATSMLTGGAGSLAMAEGIASKGFGKIVMQAAKYGAQFNIMGLPQYADAIKTGQNFDVYANIFAHNMALGSGASLSGQAGRFMSNKLFNNVGFTKELMKRNPAILETVGALPGSFGFGYGSSKIAGSTDEDALATGFAFAAMHFADAGAFKRMMKLQSQKDVKVFATKWDSKGNPTSFSHDYFVQEGDKLFKIDNEKFANGEISKVSDAIELDSKMKDELYYYNEIPNHTRMTYSEALESVRVRKLGKTVYDKWVKELPEDYVKENSDKIRYFAELTARSTALGNLSSMFSRTKLPDNKDIQGKIVKIADDYKMSYQSVKTFLITNLKEFANDPVKFKEKIDRWEGAAPPIVDDLNKLVTDVDKIVAKNALAQWGMLELEQPNRQIIKPRVKEDFSNYFIRTMNTKYPDAITKNAEGKPVTDNWWGLDYEKYRTEQVMAQADYDSFQKKAKKEAKTEEKPAKTKETKVGKEKTIKDTSIKGTTENVEPKQSTKDLSLLKNIIDSYNPTEKKISPDSEHALVKEAERLQNMANKDIKGKRGRVESKEMAVLMLQDSGLTEPEIKLIIDKAFGENVNVNNIKAKFKPESEKFLDLMNKGVVKDIADYDRVLREETAKNKESLTEKESVEKYVEDKEVADLINEEIADKIQPNTDAEIIKETGTFTEKMRKPHSELSEEAKIRYADTIAKLKEYSYNPESPKDIRAAKNEQVITPRQANELISSLQESGKSEIKEIDVTGKVKEQDALINIIDTFSKGYLGKGLTTEKAIDKAVEEGSLNADEAKILKNTYSKRQLGELFNTSNLSKLKPATPEEREAFVKTTKEVLGSDVELGDIDQTGVPKGQVRTAMTYTEDGKVKIRISELAGKDAFEEETGHAILLTALDQVEVTDALTKLAGWNGEKSDWARAHEDLYRQMAAAKAGYMPSNRIFEKITDWLDRAARWFGLNGYKGAENFFRRYARGLIKIDKDGYNRHADAIDRILYNLPKELTEGMIRSKLKSFDFIKDDETIDIHRPPEQLYARLKNKGVKNAEIEYIRFLMTDHVWGKEITSFKGDRPFGKITGAELKLRIAEKLFPIHINVVRESNPSPFEGFYFSHDYRVKTVIQPAHHKEDGSITPEKRRMEFYEAGKEITEQEYRKAYQSYSDYLRDHSPASGRYDNLTTSGDYGAIRGQELTKEHQATNYRILSFDIEGVDVKQVHNYLSERKESVGWARAEVEVVDGVKTGYLNVNEIQGELQYTKAPKWEDLKVGDVVKLRGIKYEILSKDNKEVLYQDVKTLKAEARGEETDDIQGGLFTKEQYEADASMGSQPEYLESLKPVFTDLQIKSLIQYAADAGYKGVRFPTMKSISKIEGFDRFADEIQKTKDDLKRYETYSDIELKEWLKKVDPTYSYEKYGKLRFDRYRASAIASQKQHLQDLINAEKETAIPVMNYYEETVGTTGRKLRKENWNKTTDKYGNEWFETQVKPEDVRDINLYNTVLQDMMNKDRVVDAKKHVDELGALYNTVGTTGDRLDEKFLTSRVKSLLELSGIKRKIPFNKVQKIVRELRPPVIEKETSPRFKPIYRIGEEQIIREIPGIRNEMIREHLKDGGILRDMAEDEITDMLQSYKRYGEELRDGILTEDSSAKEFKERYHLNEKQSKMVDASQSYVKAYNNKAREWWSDYLFVEGGNLAKGISKRKLAELMPDLVKEKNGKKYIRLGEIGDYLNQPENADIKRQLADYIAKRMYPQYTDKIYLNEVRPSDPRYSMIRMEKTSDNPNHTPIKDEAGNIVGYKDYVDTYGYNDNHTEAVIKQWEEQGFRLTEKYKIKDLIQGQQWDKLTLRQLTNLLEAGNIQLSYIDENGKVRHNPIVDKLLNAVKSGTYKQHSIHKGHIRGMHYIEKEFERNLHAFGDEVLGIKRQAAIIRMQKELTSWKVDVDPLLKSPTLSQAEKDKELRAYDYAQKYTNNLSHSDRNFIDNYKGYVGMYYTSMKPSFFVQQLLQGLQTTWHLARGVTKTGESHFVEGSSDAWKLMMYLRAKQNNQSTESFGISDEVAEIYQWLADRKKLGKVGIAELTETKTDLEYKYLSGGSKNLEAFKRVMNVPSAAIEKFTRMQSMMTFYRIGKEQGLSGNGLKQFIADNIDLSMSEWGVGGRSPVFASGQAGKGQHSLVKALDKSFFTFKTFATHNLALYEYLMRNKLWGALGTKLMAGVAFHGITKFPLMATMWAIANIFSDDDVEYESLRLLEDLDKYVPKLGTLLARGGGGLAGLSMENLFDERSILPTDTWDNLKAKSWEGKLAESMFGAPYGLGKDAVTSADAIFNTLKHIISSDRQMTDEEKERTIRNLAKGTPLYMRNAINTLGFDRDGVELRGKTIIKREDLDWRDVVLKAMSFNPLKYAKAYEEQFSGFPAKWARVNGKITELKKIRKELKGKQLRGLALELEKTMGERSKMMRTKDYQEAKSKGLI